MGWSTTYDDEYLRGVNGEIASAEAYGDREMAKELRERKKHAMKNYGKPINGESTSR